MTKENLIPKTETVCEIDNKYEVPSFEEFMKTYEADESLNYDDLNYSDISDKGKGYGPCYERCGWNNPYCSYQEWMKLCISCPQAGCTSTVVINWTHKEDGGVLEVSNCANVRCKNCRKVAHIREWCLSCSDHRGVFREVGCDSFVKALNLAFGMQENKKLTKELLQFLFDNEW